MLKNEILELRVIIEQLRSDIAMLKGGKNSRTSSTAPSQDIGRSNKYSLRQPSDKPSGGQKGHSGHNLPLSSTPDEIIHHEPHKCEHCGEDIQNIASDSFTRRQIVDIPPINPTYTEHRVHTKTCPHCGTKNNAKFPESVNVPIQYGSNIQALIGYLSVYQSIPYKRICSLFKVFGLNISQGTVDNILERLSNKSQKIYDDIKNKIQASDVVGADETGCRVNGKKHWFHVWQNQFQTLIVSFASRGYKVIETHFVDGFKKSIYVSDCWSSQLKVAAKEHQLCFAHLLRELTNFIENLNSQWSRDMKNLFMRALELKNRMRVEDYSNPPLEVIKINAELDQLLKVDCSTFHKKEQAFVKRLIKNRQSIFTFLSYMYVPPDNNASERAIRNVKIKTKVSGQFRNAEGKGADRYAKIRSVIDTTIKNGMEVYDSLTKLAMDKG
jgi:transposase